MPGWKKIKSKIIHKNPWYFLSEDDVIRPNGTRGKYYVIDGISSVVIIVEDKQKKIYLVGQNRYTIGNIYSWEIIGGSVKKDCSILKGAKRELQEETGIIAKEWINLGYFYPLNGHCAEKCFIYLVRDLEFTESNPEPTENITVRKETLRKIIKMIKDNEITDGQTIAAIYKYLLYLRG